MDPLDRIYHTLVERRPLSELSMAIASARESYTVDEILAVWEKAERAKTHPHQETPVKSWGDMSDEEIEAFPTVRSMKGFAAVLVGVLIALAIGSCHDHPLVEVYQAPEQVEPFREAATGLLLLYCEAGERDRFRSLAGHYGRIETLLGEEPTTWVCP